MHASTLQASSTDVAAALTVALKFKYAQQAFYTQGYTTFNATSGTSSDKFTAAEDNAVKIIRDQETAQIAVLASAIGAGAPSAPAPSSYDWTGGSGAGNGPFDQSMISRGEFFKVAQILEDTGVRAIKGQIPALFATPELTTLVQIHSTEGRHAAMVRMLRSPGGPSYDTTPPWPGYGSFAIQEIIGWDIPGTPALSGQSQIDIMTLAYGPLTPAAHYGEDPPKSPGEDNLIQSSSFYANKYVNSTNDYTPPYAIAFDEPMDATRALTVAAFFGVS